MSTHKDAVTWKAIFGSAMMDEWLSRHVMSIKKGVDAGGACWSAMTCMSWDGRIRFVQAEDSHGETNGFTANGAREAAMALLELAKEIDGIDSNPQLGELHERIKQLEAIVKNVNIGSELRAERDARLKERIRKFKSTVSEFKKTADHILKLDPNV